MNDASLGRGVTSSWRKEILRTCVSRYRPMKNEALIVSCSATFKWETRFRDVNVSGGCMRGRSIEVIGENSAEEREVWGNKKSKL